MPGLRTRIRQGAREPRTTPPALRRCRRRRMMRPTDASFRRLPQIIATLLDSFFRRRSIDAAHAPRRSSSQAMQKFSRHPCGFCQRRLLPIVTQVNAHNTNARIASKSDSILATSTEPKTISSNPPAPFFPFPLVTSLDFFVPQVDTILVSCLTDRHYIMPSAIELSNIRAIAH
jgi:hypothetical protein